GVKVILDLTPNYRGDRGWFNETVAQGSDFQSKVKDAMEYWLAQGVAGIYFGSIEDLHNAPDLLSEWRNVTANHSTEGNARVLLAATDDSRSDRVLTLLNQTEMGLLSSRYLLGNDNTSVSSPGERIKQYLEAAGDQWINWAVRTFSGDPAPFLRCVCVLYSVRLSPAGGRATCWPHGLAGP
ncbi:hypothetical protein FKM82_030423, partial [Ascaphus truei]